MGDGADFLGGGGAGRWDEDGQGEEGDQGATHRCLWGGIDEGLLGGVGWGLYGAHLVPYVAMAFLVELDDVHDSLGVLFLL